MGNCRGFLIMLLGGGGRWGIRGFGGCIGGVSK